MPHSKDGAALRATLSVTLVIFVSKSVGFIRDVVSAHYFGTSAESSAYTAAYGLFYLPVFLLSSCITSTMVPMYLEVRQDQGRLASHRFASASLNLFAIASVLISVAMYALCEPLVFLLYPSSTQAMRGQIIELTRVMLPSLAFVVISIVQSSVMNARERYFAGQLSGFPYSILTILAAVLFASSHGILATAWATTLSGVFMVLVIVPFQRGVFRYRIGFSLRDKRIRRLALLAAPSMAAMAVNEINHQIDRSMASGLGEGAISAMNYAFRLITFVLGVVILPIITVMFSRMSERAAAKDHASVASILTQCVEVVCAVLSPIVAIGSVLSLDIMKLLFMSGKFTIESARGTSAIFVMYLLGTVFFALRDLLSRGFHSIQNTRIPLYVSMVTVALNVALNWALSRVMGPPGLALATSIAGGLGVLLLFAGLRKKLEFPRCGQTMGEALKCAVGAAFGALAAFLLSRYVPQWDDKGRLLLRLLLCGGPGLLVYLAALRLLRVRQVSFLRQLLRRR